MFNVDDKICSLQKFMKEKKNDNLSEDNKKLLMEYMDFLIKEKKHMEQIQVMIWEGEAKRLIDEANTRLEWLDQGKTDFI